MCVSKVQTVCGPIKPEQLGFCHCHEHILIAKGKSFEVDPAICIDDPEKSLQEVQLFKLSGGESLVDAQPVGCGRTSEELVRISCVSNVNIIASTGFHKLIFYRDDHWVFTSTIEQLEAVFVHELETGMFTDGDRSRPKVYHSAKAGIIKTALDSCGLDNRYTQLFKAAASAAVKTSSPILIHVEKGSDPIALDDFLQKEGVLAEKRIYCHLDRAVSDLGVHRELLKRGCFAEYDTICRSKYHDDIAEIDILLQMIDAGFGDKILLGLDTTSKRMKAYGADFGLDYIQTKFIPLALSRGISKDALNAFMVQNPASALAISRQLFSETQA